MLPSFRLRAARASLSRRASASPRSAPRPRAARAGVHALAVLALVTGWAALPAAAAGAPVKAIWGPPQIGGVSQFPVFQDLGADLLEYPVSWNAVAPSRPANPTDPADPAYRWPADLDLAVAEGQRTGIGILVLVLGTPSWAQREGLEPRHPPTNVGDYAQFMEALARRYPSIRHFMVWGEPIRNANYDLAATGDKKRNVKPGEKAGSVLPRTTPELRRQVGAYARMVDATWLRLKALNRANLVIGGNTTTDGDIDPFNWVKWMRLPSGKPPRMDLFGHNPFGTRGPDLKKTQIRRGSADFSDLDDYLPWIKRWQQRGGRNGKLRLFVSEYTAPTDVTSYEFNYHVTRALQAKWLAAAWKIAKQQKLYGLGWIGLYDLTRPGGGESRTGLIDGQGVKKPAYDVFKALK